MTKRELRERRRRAWLLSGAVALALLVSLGSLGRLLQGIEWWLQAAFAGIAVLAAAAGTRAVLRWPFWPTLAGAVAGIVAVTVTSAPLDAFLGIVPVPETFAAFRELVARGEESIASQATPARADEGIRFLVTAAAAGIALVVDAIAHWFRSPALVGIPLLIIVSVPSVVHPTIADPLPFVLAAACYLLVLRVGARVQSGAALGLGAAVVVAALLVPAMLPPVRPAQGAGGGSGITTGLNPILDLGADLRRSEEVVALTYTTTAPGGVYLRTTSLDEFSGPTWSPGDVDEYPDNPVDAIPPAPGRAGDVAVDRYETTVQSVLLGGRWLPVPYAPESVSGLDGDWYWEPEALAVRSETAGVSGQDWEVVSTEARPTQEQLRASGTNTPAGFEPYLRLPDELPDIVRETAQEVAGAEATSFDRAVALQRFFRGPAFSYSELAPVREDYDGSGAEVLGEFLEERSGYCVHFSSAMAAMARSLGIPARISVGFAPGQPSTDSETDTRIYTVSSYDAHAWPELWFEGAGWVRFEPTPGRGAPQNFAQALPDDPTTPENEATQAPTTAPSAPAPTPTSTPGVPQQLGPDGSAAQNDRETSNAWMAVFVLAGLLVLAAPAIARLARRSRRFAALGRAGGSALDAWDEVRDTAEDHGRPGLGAPTPREFADSLRDIDSAALDRLRLALELERFAERPVDVDPADVREVCAAIAQRASFAQRIRAVLMPASVLSRFVPRLAARADGSAG